MTPRLATLCCTLVAGAAAAQVTAIPQISVTRIQNPNLDTFTFGAAQCGDTIGMRWTNTLLINLTGCIQQPLKLWATAGECRDIQGAGDTLITEIDSFTLNNVASGRQGTFTVKVLDLPNFKNTTLSDGGILDACGSAKEFTLTHRVCGSVEYKIFSTIGCGDSVFQTSTPFKLVYDTQPPGPPSITDFTAQDKAVRLTFTSDTDTAVVILEAKGPTDLDFVNIAEVANTATSIRGEGLQNNVDYLVRLRARDAAGNTSVPSAEVTVTPIRTLGFWGFYHEAGGTDPGGCSVGVGLLPMLIVALAFRRSRKEVRRES